MVCFLLQICFNMRYLFYIIPIILCCFIVDLFNAKDTVFTYEVSDMELQDLFEDSSMDSPYDLNEMNQKSYKDSNKRYKKSTFHQNKIKSHSFIDVETPPPEY